MGRTALSYERRQRVLPIYIRGPINVSPNFLGLWQVRDSPRPSFMGAEPEENGRLAIYTTLVWCQDGHYCT